METMILESEIDGSDSFNGDCFISDVNQRMAGIGANVLKSTTTGKGYHFEIGYDISEKPLIAVSIVNAFDDAVHRIKGAEIRAIRSEGIRFV